MIKKLNRVKRKSNNQNDYKITYLNKNTKQKNTKTLKLGILCLLIFLGCNFTYQQYKIWTLNNEISEVQEQCKIQEKHNTDLKQKIKLLNDSEYVAKVARDKLGLVKKGESVYKISANN